MAYSHLNVKAFNAAVFFKTQIQTQNKKGKKKYLFIAILSEKKSENKTPNFIAFIEINAEYIKNLNLNTLFRIV